MKLAYTFSLGPRIAALVAATVFVAATVIASLLSYYQWQQTLETQRNALENTAIVYATAIADHVESNDTNAIKSVLRSVQRLGTILNVSAIDRQGKALVSLGQKAVLEPNDGAHSILHMLPFNNDHMTIAVDIIKQGERRGQLVLLADTTATRDRFYKSIFFVFVASSLACILAIGFSIPVQKRITSPLRNLAQNMREFDASTVHTPLALTGEGDETELLIKSFNNLIVDVNKRDIELQKIAFYDSLTGLQNAASLVRKLDAIFPRISDQAHFALLQFSIRDLVRLGNAFGKETSDKLVMFVAHRLLEILPLGSEIARLSNSDFAALVPDVGQRDKVEQLISLVQSFFLSSQHIADNEFHVNINASGLLLPKDAQTSADALRRLNLVMEESHRLGSGRSMLFQPQMEANSQEEIELGQALREAVADLAIDIHLQPQFDVRHNAIVGFEALARWTHPVRGPISPAIFVPLAERLGIIAQLGNNVLVRACEVSKRLTDANGERAVISVNVSPAQMFLSGFVESVKLALASSSVPAHRLCLEVTESVFVGESAASVKSVLINLQASGVELALDDFGTGYSSLSYLSELPFNKLKIDRSFVRGATVNEKRRKLLESMIVMAKNLDLRIIAEGAETAQEAAILTAMGVDQIQGYYFGRPMPVEQAIATLRQNIQKSA